MNFGTVRKVGDAALQAITVDEHTNPKTLLDLLAGDVLDLGGEFLTAIDLHYGVDLE